MRYKNRLEMKKYSFLNIRRCDGRILFMSVLALCAMLTLNSCGGYDQHMKKGDKFLALGEYYDASEEFKLAYRSLPAKEKKKRGIAALRQGNCYYMIKSPVRAISAYRNAQRYNVIDSLTSLRLGQMLLMNGSYRDAEKEFTAALTPPADDDTTHFDVSAEMEQLLRVGLESAKKAPKWKEEGSGYVVKKFAHLNGRRSDYSPMLLGDQSDYVYFTSTRNEAQGDEYSGITGVKCGDIFFCQKDDKGKWSKPAAVEGGLNTEYDEGSTAFSVDGGTMYLTQCSTDPDYPRYAKIVTSNRSDASWSAANKFDLSRDTLSSFAHPAVSPDGKWLYFTSDMPGGKGGLDIWRVNIQGAYIGGVENIGEPVNTPGDEMFPAFRPNGDFYFSSNGHPGMGGLDIFLAKIDTTGHYKIEQLGYPLNSAGDDFGMTFEGMYNRGFFSSNRGDGKGWDHIYSFEKDEVLQILTGWVYEMDGYELPSAVVYLVGNDGTNMRINVKSDGSFTELLDPNVDYVMLATCKGYLNHKEEIRVPKVTESQEYTLQFPLPSISSPVLIRNIFFDFGKATLRPESSEALDKLVVMLEENPNITIELGAHTDYHSSEAFNMNLSQQRAKAVCDYLVEHGVNAERLTPKGYGETVPKTVSKKVAEKNPWLKEGDVLTEEFITALPDKEKQDFCDQINRRTEFRVLKTTYGILDNEGKLKENYIPKPKKEESEEPVPDDDWLDW